MRYLHLFPSAAPYEVIAIANYSKELPDGALATLLRSGRASGMSQDAANRQMQAAVQGVGWLDVIVHR